DVVRVLGHEEAAELREARLDRELVDLLEIAAPHRADCLPREADEVGLVRRDTDVVELLVRKERAHGAEGVTRSATALSVEQHPATLRGGADRLRVPRDEPVEGRVAGREGPFEGGDRRREVVIAD